MYPELISSQNLSRSEAFAGVFDIAANVSISPQYLSDYAAFLYESSPAEQIPASLEAGVVEIVDEASAGFGLSQISIISYGWHKFYFEFVDPPFDKALAISTLDTVDSSLGLSLVQRLAIRRGIDGASVALASGVEFDLVESFMADPEDQENERSSLSKFLDLNMPQYRAVSSMYVVTAFCVAFYVSVLYIPSFVSTVLQFRCGIIPSLRDPYFAIYRKSLDVVTILFGKLILPAWLHCLVSSYSYHHVPFSQGVPFGELRWLLWLPDSSSRGWSYYLSRLGVLA